MEKILNRFELLKIDLRETICERRVSNQALVEVFHACIDDVERKFIQEDIMDNEAIIEDSKAELEQLNEIIALLSHDGLREQMMKEIHKKKTLPASNESISNNVIIANNEH